MHAAERERAIMELLERRGGFITFRDLESCLSASPATLRRDLERMDGEGLIRRIRGGARLPSGGTDKREPSRLSGVPFHENIRLHRPQKEAIGRAAARLCKPGSAVMIDGGSTTLQMCPHLEGLQLQVLTNSLHIASALLPQKDTRIVLPGGAVFREQDIILSAAGEDLMPRFYAPQLFMGAASVGARGVMQADVVLVAAERRLIERADRLILLVDSSKFSGSSGSVVCELRDVDVVITDSGIDAGHRDLLAAADIELIIADSEARSSRDR